MEIINNQLVHDGIVMGSTSVLYLHHQELRGVNGGTVRCVRPLPTLPCDMVFVAGDKIVGVESKMPSDLLTSQVTRRLHRQVALMLRMFDVTVVMCRGNMVWEEDVPKQLVKRLRKDAETIIAEFYQDVVRWEMLGVVWLWDGPWSDLAVPGYLASYKSILGGTNNVLKGIAGTDRKPLKGTLLRAIPGVGTTTADKLVEAFGSVGAALSAGDEAWKEVGATKRMVEGRRKALG